MNLRFGIFKTLSVAAAVALSAAACGKLDDAVDSARTRIESALKTQGAYERGNLPIDNPPTPEAHKGDYDIVDGAYRYITNERREGRAASPQIAEGDSVAFYFDGRVFTGGTFDSQTTFYTNIAARIKQLAGNNEQFSTDEWPTRKLRVKVGDDGRILKSLQRALISCRAGDGDPANDDLPGGVASDRVLVYLTPDIAFGDRTVYGVPAGSTLVFEITEIEIIK